MFISLRKANTFVADETSTGIFIIDYYYLLLKVCRYFVVNYTPGNRTLQ